MKGLPSTCWASSPGSASTVANPPPSAFDCRACSAAPTIAAAIAPADVPPIDRNRYRLASATTAPG